MLLYCNRSALRTIFRSTGSIIWRPQVIVLSLLVAMLAVGFELFSEYYPAYRNLAEDFLGINAMGTTVGVAAIFRTSFGWQRYWEAATNVHSMYSKWADAYSQVAAFLGVTLKRARASNTPEAKMKRKRVEASLEKIERGFILMSAVAADRLSHSDTTLMDEQAKTASWSKGIVLREELTQVRLNPEQPHKISAGTVASARSEGGVCLPRLFDHMSQEERDFLSHASDKVSIAMAWINFDLADISGDVDLEPPIQCRVFQELSIGMLSFQWALSIADVPFPFPYAQIVSIMLFAFAVLIPVYTSYLTASIYLSPVMSFLIFHGIWGINEIAKELENPFGGDPNDICLADFHADFVGNLREITGTYKAHLELEPLEVHRLSHAMGPPSQWARGGPSPSEFWEDLMSPELALPPCRRCPLPQWVVLPTPSTDRLSLNPSPRSELRGKALNCWPACV
mmetsp:Transcript_64629/g.140717  ORF Transcript_64629/g.140717 Transcript_64629/m.140717 type:complete len:454 (-) Transcript_64629:37-1398(-)